MIRAIFKFSNFLILSFLFPACEKDINIKLDPTTTNLVVNASIENGNYPLVTLSRSLDYFNKIDPHILSASFIHNAQVTMSNGQVTAQLKEDSIPSGTPGLEIYFYTFKITDTGTQFKGAFNTTYNLQILVDNKTYSATTTIPPLDKLIDSLWWTPAPDSADSGLVNIKAMITDPPGLGNYTRYYTSVNGGLFFPGLNSVFDDQITDGTTYTVTVPQGVNRNIPIDFNTYGFFNKGDSVIVKMANIDKGTYDFWRTMEYNYQSVGNPFSTPTEVISNVSNGALGYFGGYAAQYKPLIIPR
jgi:hypothetical protein